MKIKTIYLLNTVSLFGLVDPIGKNTYESLDYRFSDRLSITDELDYILFSYEADGQMQKVATPRSNVRQIIGEPYPILPPEEKPKKKAKGA